MVYFSAIDMISVYDKVVIQNKLKELQSAFVVNIINEIKKKFEK